MNKGSPAVAYRRPFAVSSTSANIYYLQPAGLLHRVLSVVVASRGKTAVSVSQFSKMVMASSCCTCICRTHIHSDLSFRWRKIHLVSPFNKRHELPDTLICECWSRSERHPPLCGALRPERNCAEPNNGESRMASSCLHHNLN